MAAAGSYDKRNCVTENVPCHDIAVHGAIRVKYPLKKRRSDGWCPNCVKEGNKKSQPLIVIARRPYRGGHLEDESTIKVKFTGLTQIL